MKVSLCSASPEDCKVNELLLATSKALVPPGAVIQGISQRVGTITGMQTRTQSSRYAAKNGKVYFGAGGRNSGATYSGDVQVLDVDTLTATVLGQDSASGDTDRQIEINSDASGLFLLAGNNASSGVSTRKLNPLTGAYMSGGYGQGVFSTGHAHGILGNKCYIIGVGGGVPIYRIDFDAGTTTKLTAMLPQTAGNGWLWSSATVGSIVYMWSIGTGLMYMFNMATETLTSGTALPNQVWAEGVPDGQGNIYMFIGSQTSLVTKLIKYNTATDTKTTITITGEKPVTAAYTTYGMMPFWYNGAIYYFRCGLNTAEGTSLYRII